MYQYMMYHKVGCSVQISTHPLFWPRFQQAWLLFDLPVLNFRHPILIHSQDWTWSLYSPVQTKNIEIPLRYHWNTIEIPLRYHWDTIDMPVLLALMILEWPTSTPEDAEDAGGERCGATLSRYVCNFAIRDAQYRTLAKRHSKTQNPRASTIWEATLGGKPPSWVARYVICTYIYIYINRYTNIRIYIYTIYIYICIWKLAILAMDKKHLFHTVTVNDTWYTNINWGFSSMRDYQMVLA